MKNAPPSCTAAAAATSAALFLAEAPLAASSSTQAAISPRAWSSRSSTAGVAARASPSHAFMTFSTAAAPSAKLSRPTMRPLPFKVWKERRSMVRVCWLDGSARAAGKVSATSASTSCASPIKISSNSASMAASPTAAGGGAASTGSAAGAGTGTGVDSGFGSTSKGVSPATCFSNGSSSKRPAAASKRKR